MKNTFVWLAASFLTLSPSALLAERPAAPFKQAAIASAHPLATEAGFEVLNAGGNAFDAAVAVSAALAVVEPAGSGLGGGGFWLLHRASDGHQMMIDGRERAPLAATPDMYFNPDGSEKHRASIDGALAAGIPGEPAALAHMAEKYGRLPLAQSLAPAIRYAEQGYVVDERMARLLAFRQSALAQSPAAADVFLNDDGTPLAIGALVRQSDLANTLRQLAVHGRDGFYAGAVAQALIDGVRVAGGIWTRDDLATYRAIEREPIIGRYHDYQIVAAAPPSSGGVVLAQALAMLERFDMAGASSVQRTHWVVEAMRRAYRDRAGHLGDPDYVPLPLRQLLSPDYLRSLSASIRSESATPSHELPPAAAHAPVGVDTTHFSIVDHEGNRVAATLSINLPFGSAFMPPGTGVLLNDEMDDFSKRPGVPNAYGLVHGEANAIAPGKRMLSSMTPTFIESDRGVAVLGTPGGSRIISMVLLAALHYMQGEGDNDLAAEMVALPRFHHQYLPDLIQHEPDAFGLQLIEDLQGMGHALRDRGRHYGNMQVIVVDAATRAMTAASDPRGVGLAAVRTQKQLIVNESLQE